MTHAFFKALLFMAAGSLIGAMAGDQSLDRMSGFRRAMPFTFGCFVVGGLALAGIPPFSGFFSKDEIIATVAQRHDWHWALYALGYAGSFLTAIYTFRMIFRAFFGEPCPEARELEEGHLAHAEQPVNPATGEVEDTDVGFPGPEHHIAERSPSMAVAMGTLAVLATVGGLVQIPRVTSVVDRFLEPAFRDSRFYGHLDPSGGFAYVGLAVGAVLGVAGIAVAWQVWVKRPGTSAALIERFSGLHRFLVNKWYFDELIDAAVVRPGLMLGRFGQQTFERVVVNGVLVGGTTGIVRAGSAAVRAAQSGFVRYYAALLLLGLSVLGLYFLVVAS